MLTDAEESNRLCSDMIFWAEFAAVADAPEYHRLNPFRYNSFFYLHVRKVKFREALITRSLTFH